MIDRIEELEKESAGLKAMVVELKIDKQVMIDDQRRIEDASGCPGDVDLLDHVEVQEADLKASNARIAELEREWVSRDEHSSLQASLVEQKIRVKELEAAIREVRDMMPMSLGRGIDATAINRLFEMVPHQ